MQKKFWCYWHHYVAFWRVFNAVVVTMRQPMGGLIIILGGYDSPPAIAGSIYFGSRWNLGLVGRDV